MLNARNVRQGIAARRGDATFGELIPGEAVVSVPGHNVSRGRIATVEIGAEVKILVAPAFEIQAAGEIRSCIQRQALQASRFVSRRLYRNRAVRRPFRS